MKPRIALVDQVWECRLPDWKQTRIIGFGYRPDDAFREWDKLRKQVGRFQ